MTQKKSAAVAAANRLSIDLGEMTELLAMHMQDEHTRHDVIHMLGAPGIGKTSIMKQVSKQLHFDGVVSFMAAQRAKEDLVGPPYLIQPEDKDNALNGAEALGYTKFYPPKVMLRLTKQWNEEQRLRHEKRRQLQIEQGEADIGAYKEPGPVILFLDEFMNAQPDVQTVYHSLILDRTFGDEEYELRDNIHIVAASNRQEDGAHVFKMSAPLATRMKQVQVQPTLDGWLDWARQAGISEVVRAFVKSRESMLGLSGIDPKIKSDAQPTPRSWEKVSNSTKMGALQVSGDESREASARKLRRLQVLVEGSVGPGAAAEFMKFVEYARRAPSAEEIAARPSDVKTFDDEPDIALVCVENMISGARRNPKWIKSFLTYSGRMHQQYRQMLETELLNLNGTMPEEVIDEMLESGNFERAAQTASRVNQVVTEGDKGDSRVRRGRAK